MKINYKEYNIAAVSLIEIMMIFAIIGIVSTACMGLAKPKYDYMTKIKIYSAYEMLTKAGNFIANEGHIDYTTDINLCPKRLSNVCTDYNGAYPNLNNQLPKVASRNANGASSADTGITNTIYASLGNVPKQQFKHLQNGLCQRLASAFSLPYANSACPDTPEDSKLIDDSTNGYISGSFSGKTPLIYLPNGQVIYISKHLYNDFQNNALGIKKYIVYASSTNSNYSTMKTYENIYSSYPIEYFGTSKFSMSNAVTSNDNKYLNMPNETRLAAVKLINAGTPSSVNTVSFLKYLEKMWSKNKDYFNIYVDINCKMTDGFEKQCGPDTLNEDIFLFRMYRDGTVIPDYRSGFPIKYLTSKILAKDPNDSGGKYKNYSSLVPLAYSIKPIVFSMCYANMMGSYGLSYNYDHSGLCSYGVSGTAASALKPISNCLTNIGESKCKIMLNKPSFLLR